MSLPTHCHGWAFLFPMEREAGSFRRRCPDASITIIGVGTERAAKATARVIAEQRPTNIVLAGFAGALRPGLALGDIITPIGRIHTADRIIGDPAEKLKLGELHQADAVDMESSAVARVCEEHDVPFHCVRVISDTLDDRLPPELATLLSSGSVSTSSAIALLIRRPWLLPVFLRMARDTKLAAIRLADALVNLTYA